MTGKREKKERVCPGRRAPEEVAGPGLEFLELHHGAQQWMGIQYTLMGLKGKEEPRPNLSSASACCRRWCVPSTSEP